MENLIKEGLSKFNKLKGEVDHLKAGGKQNTILYSWVVYLTMCDMMFEQIKKSLVELNIEDINQKYIALDIDNPFVSNARARAEEIRAIKADFNKYDRMNKNMISSFEKLDSNPLMKLAAVKLHNQFSEWFKLEMENPDEEKENS